MTRFLLVYLRVSLCIAARTHIKSRAGELSVDPGACPLLSWFPGSRVLRWLCALPFCPLRGSAYVTAEGVADPGSSVEALSKSISRYQHSRSVEGGFRLLQFKDTFSHNSAS